MGERDNVRHQALERYIAHAFKSAKTSDLPIRDIIRNDLAAFLHPDDLKEGKPKIYRVETPNGDITLDMSNRRATSPFLKEVAYINLTLTQAKILETLMQNPTQTYTKHQLELAVKSMYEPDTFPATPEIKFHIGYLRKRLGIHSIPGTKEYPLINTVRQVGYVLLP